MAYMESEICTKRISAYAIDTSFVIMLSLLIVQLTSLIPNSTMITLFLIVFVCIGGYIIPYTLWVGQTFGKKTQKIVLTNMDGSDCKMVKIVFREAFKFILGLSTFGVYSVIAGVILLFRKDERTIHDFIFRTKVIEKVIVPRKYIRKED